MVIIDWADYKKPPFIYAKQITNNGTEGIAYDEATQILNISNVKLSPDSGSPRLDYFDNLKDVDLTGLDVSEATSLTRIFRNLRLNSVNISNWNTENVRDMDGMFMGASFPDGYILDLSSFNTKNVIETTAMFQLCKFTIYINPDTWTLTPEQTEGENCTFIEKRPAPPAEDLQTKIKKDIQAATQALATLTKSKLESISKELTQSEYNELSEEEKNNGTVYYITDTEEVPQTKVIDDNVKTDNTTWSSEKIDTTLNGALAGLNPFIPLEINNTVFQINVNDYGIKSGDILMFALGIDNNETRTVIITITNIYGIPHFTVIHNDVDIGVNINGSIITISRQWTMYMCYLYVRHTSY